MSQICNYLDRIKEILFTFLGMISTGSGYTKTGNLIIFAILAVCICPVMAGNDTSPDQSTIIQGGDPSTVIDTQYSTEEAGALKSLISETSNKFSQNPDTGTWYATNDGRQVSFSYDGTARFANPKTEFGMTLTGVGRGNDLAPAGKGRPQADGRQLNIAREGYTEWYKNTDSGIEQGLTITTRPVGNGPLRVGFALDGDGMSSVSDRQNLTFINPAGTDEMTYSGLSAFGADGKKLPARLESDGNMLYWNMDDTGAIYPVTIDPVIAASCKIKGGAADDHYGNSVAISADGSVVLVGASGASPGATHCGAANLFVRPTGGWSGTMVVSAADATFTGAAMNDNFGNSVAISADGNVAFIGAPWCDVNGKSNAGAAYLFKKPSEGWSGHWRSASNADVMFPGNAVNDLFGFSVAISTDGNVVLVGAVYASPGATNCGAANLFVKPASGWTAMTPTSSAQATFTGEAVEDEFGHSVAISADGSQAFIGAPYHVVNGKSNAGAAYLFKKPSEGWNGHWRSASNADVTFPGNAANDDFGYSIDISPDGNVVLVGASGASPGATRCGAAGLFVRPTAGWAAVTPTSSAKAIFTGAAMYDQFGNSVAISTDGSQVLIGAVYSDTDGKSDTGAAYLFRRPAGGWSGAWINANDASSTFLGDGAFDYFGNSVAISAGGDMALIGAPFYAADGKSNAGAVYLFTSLAPPVASFTTSQNSGTAPLTVQFTDTSTGNPTSWTWIFGDGGTSTVKSPLHTYTNAGTFTATLVASNTAGQSIASSIITVRTANVPTAPSITSIKPTSGQQGGKYTLTITGSNFEKDKSTVKVSAKGVTVGKYKLRSTTKIVVPITIAKTAKTGPRTFTITNPSSGLTATKTFPIKAGPTIKKISPTSGVKGKKYTITITGTNFEKDKSTVKVSGTGVTVGKYKTRTTSKIVVPVTISKKAKVGKRTLTVTNPKGGGTSTRTFTVKGTSSSSSSVWSSDPVAVMQRPVVFSQNVPGLTDITGKTHSGNSIISPPLMAGTG